MKAKDWNLNHPTEKVKTLAGHISNKEEKKISNKHLLFLFSSIQTISHYIGRKPKITISLEATPLRPKPGILISLNLKIPKFTAKDAFIKICPSKLMKTKNKCGSLTC